ncbi:MAG: M56 family metallopeptidase [Verrucomicrobiota bacterium]
MKLSPEFLFTLAQSLGWALIHSLWQGALVGCALLAVLRLLARSSASLRHTACMGAMGMMLLLTTFTLIRAQRLDGGPAAGRAIVFLQGEPENAHATVAVLPGPIAVVSPNLSSPPLALRGWRELLETAIPWVAALWFAGILILFTRQLFAWRLLHGWKKRGLGARPELRECFAQLVERFGVHGKVILLESSEVAAPMLAGIFRAVILLPLRVVAGLSEREMAAILAHELAHFVRRDAWSNLAQVMMETIFFYHPVVWWMGRRTREEREHAADDLALEVCEDRRIYAGALSHLAEFNLEQTSALAANGGSLLARIRRIIKPAEVEVLPSRWSVGVPMLISLLGLLLLVRVQAQNTRPATVETAAPSAGNLAVKAADEMKGWLAEAFQLDDAAKRQAAIERIRQAMQSDQPEEARAGIKAFIQIGAVEFDKVSFRPAVRALLNSSDPATRSDAAAALVTTGADPEDVARVLAMADDPAPEMRSRLSWVIMQLHGGDLTGPGGEAVLKLLSGNDRGQLREVLRGIWGGRFSPALEARVIELSQNLEETNGTAYDAMYFALSTQANKSEASVKRLIELLAHPDTRNVAGRCAWGLQQGVSREQFGLVANAMVKLLDARSDNYLREHALQNLERYGSPEQVPAVRGLLAKPGVTGIFREGLERMRAAWERPAVPVNATATATAAPAFPPAAEKATIEVEWKGKWWPATVLKKEGERTLIHYVGFGAEWDEWVGADRLRPLSGQPGAGLPSGKETSLVQEKEAQLAALLARHRQAARQRADEDRKRYSIEQLREIETLYQVANSKGKRSEEARASLTQLLNRYYSANRTGCALLYLGQASEGEQRLDYLTRAVEKFSDCYYFNGCQVGGYGRYVLALTLWEKGEKEKARKFFEEIKTTYKDAIDHRGRPMPELVEAAEKELAARQ